MAVNVLILEQPGVLYLQINPFCCIRKFQAVWKVVHVQVM